MKRLQLHDVLRMMGRGCVIAGVLFGFGFREYDAATFNVALGAVLLWQGGFDFGDMTRRYR